MSKHRPRFLDKEEVIALPDGREARLKHRYLRRSELPGIAIPLLDIASAYRAKWAFAITEWGDGRRALRGNLAFTFPWGKASLVLISENDERWDKVYAVVRGSVAKTLRSLQGILCPLMGMGLITKPQVMARYNAKLNYALEGVDFSCEEV